MSNRSTTRSEARTQAVFTAQSDKMALSRESNATATVSSPPRRVPSLYPTSPPTSIPIDDRELRDHPRREIAHSMRPKPAAITMESIREERNATHLAQEESAEQSLYDLFEVSPRVSEDELRRSYKRLWACYHPDHYAAYGLYSRPQLEALLDMLQSGFELLMDPKRRQEYDQERFPNGLPDIAIKAAENSQLMSSLQPLIQREEARAQWLSGDRTELPLRLQRLREANNISLTAVHERSKISLSVLKGIEAGKLEVLPARIYLKGFLRELMTLYSLDQIEDIDTTIEAWLR